METTSFTPTICHSDVTNDDGVDAPGLRVWLASSSPLIAQRPCSLPIPRNPRLVTALPGVTLFRPKEFTIFRSHCVCSCRKHQQIVPLWNSKALFLQSLICDKRRREDVINYEYDMTPTQTAQQSVVSTQEEQFLFSREVRSKQVDKDGTDFLLFKKDMQRLVSASSGSEGILYSDDRRTALPAYSISGVDPAYSIKGNALPVLPIANVFFLAPTVAARLDRRRLLLPCADADSPRRPLLRRSYSLVDPS
nr:uncharacterized protein LOC109163763 [Ipomoea batatas]